MRFLNILNADMLEKRIQRLADRNGLSALIGQVRFALEMNGDKMPEEKRNNLQNIADLGDKVIEDNTDLEATCVALYDSATQHADEVRVLRLQNASQALKIKSLEGQLDLTSEK